MSAGGQQDAREKRIQRGARAHYEDAVYYDLAYKRRRHDVRFYTQLAAKSGGPVLELGVGTGRVALSVARAGVDVVGIEPAPEMLAHAHEKAGHLPETARARLSLRSGDARSVRLKRRFKLVTAPFNVFMHLYTREDFERALATVRVHLSARGRFVFDVSMPDLGAMNRNPSRFYRGREVLHPGSGKRYAYLEAFEYDAVRQVQMVSMVFQNLSDLADVKTLPLSQRQWFPCELEALLHYNGFRVEHMWGDFEQNALASDSESQIIVARLR
jgi:SAM-dependent methyltransferase